MYISSDFTPYMPEASLFWYPNLTLKKSSANGNERIECIDESTLNNPEQIDSLHFNPLILNHSMQPNSHYILPDMDQNTSFIVPLFVRSESCGAISVRLRFEYIPAESISAIVSKDFEVPLNVVKPLGMTFLIVNGKDASCGLAKEPGSSTVMQANVDALQKTAKCSLSANTPSFSHALRYKLTYTCIYRYLACCCQFYEIPSLLPSLPHVPVHIPIPAITCRVTPSQW